METAPQPPRIVSDAEVVALLREAVREAGSQRRYAVAAGLHESDLCQVLRGRQAPSARQCAAVGVERVLVQTRQPTVGRS